MKGRKHNPATADISALVFSQFHPETVKGKIW